MIPRLYQAATLIATPSVMAYCLGRKDLRQGVWRRFWPQKVVGSTYGRHIWIHAASAGEVRLANHFAKEFLKSESRTEFLLTTNTRTGVAASMEGPWMTARLFPFDNALAVNRLFDSFSPQAVLTIELELWPGLIMEARNRKIPFFAINARMGKEKRDTYYRLNRTLDNFLGYPYFLTRSDTDFEQFRDLGIPIDHLLITGEMKVDMMEYAIKAIPEARRNLLLGVSTHEGEEKILLQSYLELKKSYPELKLALAPRHVRRSHDVEKEARSYGLRVKLVKPEDRVTGNDAEVFIENGFGRINEWLALSRIAFVGGSLVDRGGHNVLEPLLAGVPVLTGPFHHRWAQWVTLLDDEGVLSVVKDAQDISRVSAIAMDQPQEMMRAIRRAQERVNQHRGSTQRNLGLIQQILRGEDPFALAT